MRIHQKGHWQPKFTKSAVSVGRALPQHLLPCARIWIHAARLEHPGRRTAGILSFPRVTDAPSFQKPSTRVPAKQTQLQTPNHKPLTLHPKPRNSNPEAQAPKPIHCTTPCTLKTKASCAQHRLFSIRLLRIYFGPCLFLKTLCLILALTA